MAKFLENDNESPEVDLKNLTVKLAGMGLDEEIEEVIPGKKDTKDYDTADEDDSSEDKDSDKDSKEAESEDASENDENSEEESEEVADFYEKRAAERDLTLEKVEELAEEMEASSEDKKQKVTALDTIIAKSDKKKSGEKKKGKIDGLAIVGIILAIAALLGGGIWLYRASNQDPNLKITLDMFFKQYRSSKIYGSIFQMGFNCPEPSYRSDEEIAAVMAASGETAETTAVNTSKYRYFDFVLSGRVRDDSQEPIFVSGCECKENNYLKNLRFYAPVRSEEDLEVYYVVYSAFLQSFYTDTSSEACLEKVKGAYNQSIASTDTAVMVKDGNLAYSVAKTEIDGQVYFVMDIVPAKEAGKFKFATKMFDSPNLRMTDKSFRYLYYLSPLYQVFYELGFNFTESVYRDDTAAPDPMYKYFDNSMDGLFNQELVVTIKVHGCEYKDDHMLKSIRFYAPVDTDENDLKDVYTLVYSAFLQTLDSGSDSQGCVNRIKDAYAQSEAAGKAVMIKERHIAYSVTVADIDGTQCFVMDVVPVEEADSFVFQNTVK